MFRFRKPSTPVLSRFLGAQAGLRLTYSAPASSADLQSYALDHVRVKLGAGERAFAAAISALAHWQQFRLSWVEPWPLNTPIHTGEVVAIIARAAGVWWVNACRIIQTMDEQHRFGFTYATLPSHVATGEETFLIEWDANGDVVYDVRAVSRPCHLLPRIGYTFFRRTQARFRQESAQAMLRAVRGAQTSARIEDRSMDQR